MQQIDLVYIKLGAVHKLCRRGEGEGVAQKTISYIDRRLYFKKGQGEGGSKISDF